MMETPLWSINVLVALCCHPVEERSSIFIHPIHKIRMIKRTLDTLYPSSLPLPQPTPIYKPRFGGYGYLCCCYIADFRNWKIQILQFVDLFRPTAENPCWVSLCKWVKKASELLSTLKKSIGESITIQLTDHRLLLSRISSILYLLMYYMTWIISRNKSL